MGTGLRWERYASLPLRAPSSPEMEVSSRAFLVWVLLAAFAAQDILVPVMAWSCGSSRSSCPKSSPRRGEYYSPSPTHKKSSSATKAPCPSPKPPAPSPCPKSSSCSQSRSGSTTPKTPTIPTPKPTTPTTPMPTPTTPVTPTPGTIPPTFPFPQIPPFFGHPIMGPCDYWLAHPELINQIIGAWPGSLGHIFAVPPFPNMFGGMPTVPQALQNTRTDGFGSLLRQSAAALLNSVAGRSASGGFPFTTAQVQSGFLGSLSSESAAAAQAQVFKAANEGRFH